MDKYELQYNPYLVELSFSRIIGSKREECFTVQQRLQIALREGTGNWPGLLKKMIRSANNSFELVFIGRKMDYDDLNEEIQAHNGSKTPYQIKLVHKSAFESNGIAKKALQLIQDVQKRNIPEINACKQKLDEAVSKIQNEAMEVNVVGLYSCGKSTLINALLCTALLPMNVKVESNKVVVLIHDTRVSGYKGNAIGRSGNTIATNVKLTSDIMAEWNRSDDIDTIEIRGRIPFVPAGRKLIIRDTPGYGNADIDAQHDNLVNDLAANTAENAVFLFLLTPDTYQGGSCEDEESSTNVKGLLKHYAKLMEMAGKEFRDKFIFVLTFADELADQNGADMEQEMLEFRQKLAEYGISDPITVPVNSKLALLIRKKLNGQEIQKKEKNDFDKYKDYNDTEFPEYKFEQYTTISPSGKKSIEMMIQELQNESSEEARYQEAVIHCGIPALEQTILDFWDKYLIPKRIQEALLQIHGICKEVISRFDFFQQIRADQAKLTEVKKELAIAGKQKEKIKKLREEISAEMDKIHLEIDAADWQFKAETKIREATKKVENKGTVTVSYAHSILESYFKEILQIKQSLENELKVFIESTFLDQASALYQKYQSVCNEILDLHIGQLSLKSLNGFQAFYMDNGAIGKLISAYKSPVYQTVKVKNPERKGFWGFFKFWKPKEIEEERYIRDEVNLVKLVMDPMNKATAQTKQDISEMINEAQENLRLLTSYFKEELNRLQVRYYQLIEDLTDKTGKKANIESEITVLKQNLKWAQDISKQIDDLWEG